MTDVGSTTPPKTSSPESTGSGTAPQAAKDAAVEGASQAREVAGTATEGAKEVAAEASRQAGELASQASAQAKDAYRKANDELKQQASVQTGRAAEGMRSLSSQLEALTNGRPQEAGAVGDYARQATDKLGEIAGRLEDGGFDGVLDDVKRFARRSPGLFLLGAGAAGFVAGRLLRGSQAANAPEDGRSVPPSTSHVPASSALGSMGRASAVAGDLEPGPAPLPTPMATLADEPFLPATAPPSPGPTKPASR